MREREVARKRVWEWGREREEQQTQTLPVVSLLITSCEFAITKIMAEITPIGSIDSHDISNPPHFFLLQLGRRRIRKKTCDPQTLVGVVFFLFSLSRQTKAISLWGIACCCTSANKTKTKKDKRMKSWAHTNKQSTHTEAQTHAMISRVGYDWRWWWLYGTGVVVCWLYPSFFLACCKQAIHKPSVADR